MKILPFNPVNHRPEVEALLTELSNEPTTMTDEPRENAIFVGAFVDDILVGMASAFIIPKLKRRVAHIEDVIVAKEHRRGGTGKSIMTVLHGQLLMSGVTRVDLTSRKNNEIAHRFYKELGYEVRETLVFRLTFKK